MPAELPNKERELANDANHYGVLPYMIFYYGYSDLSQSMHANSFSYSEAVAGAPNLKNTPLDDSKSFIKLEQSFLNQLEDMQDVFSNQSKYQLQEKMKFSADALLSCVPDKISLELTYEGSIFYTVLKNDFKIYFQHFLVDEFDETEEAIVSVFKEDSNILNFAGALDETIEQLGKYLNKYSIQLHQFA
jgi:hypothetical protein